MERSITSIRGGCGYFTFELESYWDFVRDVIPMFQRTGGITRQEYVWRGIRDANWSLQSSLSRFASRTVKTTSVPRWQHEVAELTVRHLVGYLDGLRGLGVLTPAHDELRRVLELNRSAESFYLVFVNLPHPLQNLTLELFSHGQHHDLYTPFLDWATSPAIALFFAFREEGGNDDGVGNRAVFALNETLVTDLCRPPGDHRVSKRGESDIQFLRSMAHHNPRIVGQAGLFTWVPAHQLVNEWVVERCQNTDYADRPVLLRFLIRNQDRKECLSYLDTCNINARTAYPDIKGATDHANYRTEGSIR